MDSSNFCFSPTEALAIDPSIARAACVVEDCVLRFGGQEHFGSPRGVPEDQAIPFLGAQSRWLETVAPCRRGSWVYAVTHPTISGCALGKVFDPQFPQLSIDDIYLHIVKRIYDTEENAM